mmetsp:Transcript_3783/g.5186  ORF Transcript_3783/g.5186 Transcript_3783/m.5186 type:complete len:212 (+) Transcript_3783:236-871(+)
MRIEHAMHSRSHLVRREETRQYSSRHSSDGVHSKGVQSVVIAQSVLHLRPEVANGAGEKADEESARLVHISGRRSDGYQPRDGPAEDGRHGGMTAHDPLSSQPAESTRRGGQLSHKQSKRCSLICCKCRASVKSKPTHPKHAATYEGEEDVVRFKHLRSKALPVTQQHCGHQTCHSRRNMYRVAACIIQHSELEEKPIGMPISVCNRAIHQ